MFGIPLWAHRGYSGRYPENTMVAFAAAVEAGAAGIECDVRMTKDGHFVILHDAYVDRTTNGQGPISEMTLAEVQQLDAGSWFGEAFVGMPVTTLSSLVAYVKRCPQLVVNLEWKVSLADPARLQRAMDVLERAGIWKQVIHSSFDTQTLQAIRRAHRDANVALLTEEEQASPDGLEVAAQLGAMAIHPHYRRVTQRYVQRAHQLGLRVHPYTVDNPKAIAWLEDCGVDAVITNWPRFDLP
ncbi:glycerophosphodiester phosphodiesterase [Alicyclobacillus acidoterrestris]|uniref:glycerophosphodiester phosphodiesterase n=1 Tax=Alicyclobacillus TaxID=29330 RepID=UPI001A8D151E|nr:glycerophosphodiester phosphodiesterase family protein [Alicyclobacillus suci]